MLDVGRDAGKKPSKVHGLGWVLLHYPARALIHLDKSHGRHMSRKPNYLFLIGAPKCGTSSLARMLGEHPDVVVAKNKEPAFFTDFLEKDWTGPGIDGLLASTLGSRAEFEAQFARQPDALWRVDASTDYLSCRVSAQRIAAFRDDPDVGEVLVAVILRDPVSRAVSEYQHTVRDGFERHSLQRALELEDSRLSSGMHPLFGHVYRSRYASQIATYRQVFGDVLILDFHRIRDGVGVVNQLSDHLGLAPVQATDIVAANTSHVYRSGLIHRIIETEFVKDVARALVPSRFRNSVRQTINTMNQTSYTPATKELVMLRDALADEIAACVADPAIPTDRWKLALES